VGVKLEVWTELGRRDGCGVGWRRWPVERGVTVERVLGPPNTEGIWSVLGWAWVAAVLRAYGQDSGFPRAASVLRESGRDGGFPNRASASSPNASRLSYNMLLRLRGSLYKPYPYANKLIYANILRLK